MNTTKTAPVAKATKTPAKKTAPVKTTKKVAPAKKVKSEKKVRVTSERVSPVIASILGIINDKASNKEDLKSLRLELRKMVKATRAILKSAPVAKVTVASKVAAKPAAKKATTPGVEVVSVEVSA